MAFFCSSPKNPSPFSNSAALLGPVSASISTSFCWTSPNLALNSSLLSSLCLVGRSTAEPLANSLPSPPASANLAALIEAWAEDSKERSWELRSFSSDIKRSLQTSAFRTASIAGVSSPTISCSTYRRETWVGIGTSRRAMVRRRVDWMKRKGGQRLEEGKVRREKERGGESPFQHHCDQWFRIWLITREDERVRGNWSRENAKERESQQPCPSFFVLFPSQSSHHLEAPPCLAFSDSSSQICSMTNLLPAARVKLALLRILLLPKLTSILGKWMSLFFPLAPAVSKGLTFKNISS